MCLDRGLHSFVSIGENFFGASQQANCTDEAQHRNLRSICGDFELEDSSASARRSGGSEYMTDPIGIPTIYGETQRYGKGSINWVIFQNASDGRSKLFYPVHGCG